jgi:hypothetical protein
LKNSMSLRSHQGAVNMIDSDDLEIKLQNVSGVGCLNKFRLLKKLRLPTSPSASS